MPAIFRLVEMPSGPADAGLLGAWSITAPEEAADFSLETAPPDSTLWLANLPADPVQAGRVLLSAERALALSDRETANAGQRLTNFVNRAQKADGLSFSLADDVAGPEQELARLLAELSPDPHTASFGIGDRMRSTWAQAGRQLDAYLEQLEQQLSHFAWVETQTAGRPVARTAVDWTGSIETQWYAQASTLHVALHRRTLDLALRSRHSLLQKLAVVSRNAIRLARLPVLLGTPGGVLLALPLAWQFIQDVRQEG